MVYLHCSSPIAVAELMHRVSAERIIVVLVLESAVLLIYSNRKISGLLLHAVVRYALNCLQLVVLLDRVKQWTCTT